MSDDVEREFREFLEQVRVGGAGAAEQLLANYGPHVLRLVRRRLSRRLRPRFDSVDFVQSVWASVFRDPQRLGRLTNPRELIQFLQAIAYNKICDESRRSLQSQKRCAQRERSLETLGGRHDVVPDLRDDRQPDPEQLAVAREQWRRLVGHPPRRYRRILLLRMLGDTYDEIAAKLHVHERTVRKVVGRLLSALET